MTDEMTVEECDRVIEAWIEYTQEAINALKDWLEELENWRDYGPLPGDFDRAYRSLDLAGLGDWADWGRAGGDDLDVLAEAVKTLAGEEVEA